MKLYPLEINKIYRLTKIILSNFKSTNMKKQLIMLVTMFMLSIAMPSTSYLKAQDSAVVVVNQDSAVAPVAVDTVASPADIITSGLHYVETIPPKGSEPGAWIKWVYGLVGVILSGVAFLIAYFKKKKKDS